MNRADTSEVGDSGLGVLERVDEVRPEDISVVPVYECMSVYLRV